MKSYKGATFSLIWSKSYYLQIKKDDLESALAITKASFPGNIEVWLKDLASLLSIKLEQCPEPDPVMKNKPKGKSNSQNVFMSSWNKENLFIFQVQNLSFSLIFFFLQVLANNFAYIYTDFPMCHLTNKCQDLIKSVIREASVETLEHLLYHSITTMLSEMNKGIQPNRVFLHLDSSQTEINFTYDSGKLNLQKLGILVPKIYAI